MIHLLQKLETSDCDPQANAEVKFFYIYDLSSIGFFLLQSIQVMAA